MKKQLKSLSILIALSLFLTACGSAVAAGSWPGVTYDEDRGLVYLGYNTSISAIRADNGVLEWQYPAEAQNTFQVFSAPQVTSDGMIVVGTYASGLYKLDPDNQGTPTVNWPFAGASNRYIGAPLTADGAIYAPNVDGHIYAVDLDGRTLWPDSTVRGQLWAQPVTDGELIFLPSMDHRLYAVDMASGEEPATWEGGIDLGSAIVGTPTLSEDGLLYVSTLDKLIVTVDAQRAEVVGPEFVTEGLLWSSPTLVDGTLYVGDMSGNLYAFDASNGNQNWVLDLGSAVSAAPVLFNDLLYVGTEVGQLFSITLDGRLLEIPLLQPYQGAKYGAPVAAGDNLLVSMVGSDVVLIALDASGRVVWQYPQAQAQ